MKKLYTLLGMVGLIAFSSTSIAQCPNDNTQWLTTDATTLTSTPSTLTSCIFGGEYRLMTNMQAGSTYTFETCGDAAFDTEITVYNDATGAFIVENDDFCGLQSSVTFVSDGSDVRILVDQFPCNSNSTCMTLLGSVQGAAQSPCNSIELIPDCGQTATFSLSGSGLFDGNGPFGEPGQEQIYEFTPATTGVYSIDVTHSGGGWVDLFQKNASAGCSGTGWTFIDDVLSSATNTVNLVAGQTYFFMIDDENTTASTGTITINCPGADPCDDIVALSGCDASSTFSLSGSGLFDGNGPWATPGEEIIYSYTAPFSGDYEITVNHSGGFFVDLFFQDAANGCSGSGWTYVDDISTTATNTVNLTGGTTYFFMIDDENTTASSGDIFIECPCIISNAPDSSFVYNGPFVISGTTDDACNDCDLRPSEDRVYEIEIPCAGTYTFETCGSSFDTYLYLSSDFCSNVIDFNDDSPCGGGFSLQSSITATLQPGTYYVTVEAFSSFTTGDFDLSVSGTEDIIDIEIVSSTDVSCFGFSDGSATAAVSSGTLPFNYVWSDGQMTETASGLAAGTYTVTGTDANGCAADTATAVINQPTPLEVDLSGCAIVYGGAGIEYGCATIESSVSGGTPGYSLDWSPTGESTGSIIVCPDMTTDYTLTATDANGCVTSETWTVTYVDLACNIASNSSSSNSGSGSGSGSGSNSGSSSNSGQVSNLPSYPNGPNCPSNGSSSSASGSNSGSGSGSGSGSSSSSSSSCSILSQSSSSGSFASCSNSGSGSSSGGANSITMCYNGVTYCVPANKVEDRMECGYTLGPCNLQQGPECNNIPPADTNVVACDCADGITRLYLQYIGQSNQDLTFNAKECGVMISQVSGATTGDMITVNAQDGGLSFFRSTTYVSLDGTGFAQVEIPTNCCENPVGQVYFPFIVVGWTDGSGNSCGQTDMNGGGGGLDGMGTAIGQAGKDAFLVENGARLGQFPNPADEVSTFEFSVPETDEVSLNIVNIRGEVIATIFNESVEGERDYNVSFDVSELQSGVYFAHLTTSNGTLKKKFVVLK
jgi:hypothetical protein